MVRSSRVDQPPVSGVPVAGATVFPARQRPHAPFVGDRNEVRLTSRIQSIDVNTQIHGVLGPDSLPYEMSVTCGALKVAMKGTIQHTDLLDDSVNADGVNLTGLNDLEATVAIIVVIRGSTQRCPDAGVDVRVVLQQALLGGVVEVGAVVDAGDLRRRATKDLGPPGVEVGVEVDDRDRPVGPVDRSQQGQRDGVVTAERDHPGQGLALLRRAELVSVRSWVACENSMVALFDLVKSPCVVIPGAQVCQYKAIGGTCG